MAYALFTKSCTFSKVILTIVVPFVLHMFIGNVLEPKVFGEHLDLHPITVLLSLTFWAAVWGIIGAILSVPLTAVLHIILTYLDHPYAEAIVALLEGKFSSSKDKDKRYPRRKRSKKHSEGSDDSNLLRRSHSDWAKNAVYQANPLYGQEVYQKNFKTYGAIDTEEKQSISGYQNLKM